MRRVCVVLKDILKRSVSWQHAKFKGLLYRQEMFPDLFDKERVVIEKVVRMIHRGNCHREVGHGVVSYIGINRSLKFLEFNKTR